MRPLFMLPAVAFCFAIFFFLIRTSDAQSINLDWALSAGGSAFEMGKDVTTDNQGNVYITGYFRDVVDFDPGPGTVNLTSNGATDIFVQKLDSQGNLLWVRGFGSNSSDIGLAIAVDANGGVYTTGRFYGSVDFDPDTSSSILSATSYDIFILKLTAQGDLAWARKIGGNDNDEGLDIALDNTGNSYTAGLFRGTADFDPDTGQYELISAGDKDAFVVKLDNNGDLVWASHMGGSNEDQASALALGNNNEVFLAGHFEGTADFDPGNGVINLSSDGGLDIFVQKLDAAGQLDWVRKVGGTARDLAAALTLDGSEMIYLTGYFEGTVDFDPGNDSTLLTSNGLRDIFTLKLTPSGNFLWASHAGGSEDDGGIAISADTMGYVYTAGAFKQTADFDPGPATTTLSSAGKSDVFIQKLSPGGELVWARSFGSSQTDEAYGISCDVNNELYATGHFGDTINVHPAGGSAPLVSQGQLDIFVLKWSDQSSVGTKRNPSLEMIDLYPNPSFGRINLQLGAALETVEIAILSANGQVLQQWTEKGIDHLNFDLPSKPGFYLISVKTDHGQRLFKVFRK